MRNLVVGTDGTWNRPDQMDRGRNVPTNGVKFLRAVDEDTPRPEQVKCYDIGVGKSGFLEKYRGGIAGRVLFESMRDAYAWILRHHQTDDRLYLVGFSRGAFAERAAACQRGPAICLSQPSRRAA